MILASFMGSRLTPERRATSSDLGSRIHFGPSFEQTPWCPAREFKLEPKFGEPSRHAGARGANAQAFKLLDQFQNNLAAGFSLGEASHDGFPQIDVKGLDFNTFF
jgi:hypothetical protein